MRISLLAIILFLSGIGSWASDIRFYNVSDVFGVSVREVYAVCKDRNGFVWGASKTGILRIAENDLRLYELMYSVADNYFTRIAYNNNSSLVAYTNNGQFFEYDELYDCFAPMMDMRKTLNRNSVNLNKVVMDPEGRLWISSSDGFYKYENGELKTVLDGVAMQCVGLYDETQICIATTEGVALFDTDTYKIDYIYKYKSANETEVSDFLYDRSTGLLWVGTISNGLFCYKKTGNSFAKVNTVRLPKQPVLAIKKNDKRKSLLIGIDGQGLWELNEDGQKVLNVYKEDVNDPYSLCGDGVYDVLPDDAERVWVATYTGGLSYMDQNQNSIKLIAHQINQQNSLINNSVNKVIEDSRGDVWFATNAGLSRWNRTENKWHAYLQNEQDQAKVFLALCEDDNGNIWAGTYSSGVYLLDGKTGKVINRFFDKDEKDGVSGKFISELYKDSQGNIWMGGPRNIICYLKNEKRFRIYDQQPVYAFEELSAEKMILACTYGVISLDKKSGRLDVLMDNVLAHDLTVVGDDIWIATSGAGLIRYNYKNKSVERYTTQSGILSNYINSILHEGDNLWLGTESGLCRFGLKDKIAYTYSNNFPLSAVSFNTNSSLLLENGNLIWGTNKGAVMFKPDMLELNRTKARIFFQDISVSGSSIRKNDDLLNDTPVDKHDRLLLNYKQNNFVLELLSLGKHNSGTRFSWKMEGVDEEWSQPAELRFITYTNLPNGIHKLRIRMHDSTLSQVIDERALIVKVVPPFWETWWFRLLVSIIIIAVIVYSLRLYSNNLKQKHDKEKIRFFANMAHDIRTSLTLISAPIEQLKGATELSDKSQYYLNLAADQAGRLSSVATQLLDFEKVDSGRGQLFPVMTDVVKLISERVRIFEATAEKKEIRLNFRTDSETYLTAVDEMKIEKVVDNLISNAIKYSHAQGVIDITLNCDDKQWSFGVRDYGLGISEQAKSKLFKEFYRGDNKENSRMVGSGIGLLLVKNYVDMHHGNITFESKENEGSLFRISIPYVKTDETITETPTLKPNLQENNGKDKNMHIVVVEDNVDLRRFLVNSLSESFKVSKACDGAEAWELIRKEAPDLVVSDIMMPHMDGFELCEKVKSTFETSHVPVILLTSLSQKTKQLEGLALGADDYITKPFDVGILLQRIRTIVRNREVVREKALKMMNRTQQDEPVYANELNDRFVKKALEVVHENISNCEFDKDEFASAMHVSPSLLYQKLKALTGQSPTEFIRSIRFNHAMKLLKTRQYSITEVSEMCGFSSASYFSTAFRKHFGKPPVDIM